MAEVKLKELPKKVRDIYEKGNAALERGKLDFAQDMFLHALKKEPGLLRARELLRRIQIKLAKEKKGLAGMSTITGMGTVRAAKKAIKKDPEHAIEFAEDLMRMDCKSIQFIDIYIEAAHASGVPEAAAQALDLLIPEFFAEDKKIYRKLYSIYADMGNTAKALETAQALVTVDKGDQTSIKWMKDAAARHSMNSTGIEEAHKSGDFTKSLRNQDQAAELEQENKMVKSEEVLAKSIEKLIVAIEAEPERMNNYRALAELQEQGGDFEDARDTLEVAYEVSGGTDPEIERGISAMNVKIYEQNITYYEQEGDEENAQEMREALYAFKLEDAETGVAKYPNDNELKFVYGELLFQGGEIQRAIPLFQKSRTHPKCRQESLFYLAMCFKHKGTLDLASETLENAIAEIPEMSHTKKDMLYELGLMKEGMEDEEGAKECFKAIYQVDYEYKDVAERIEGRGAA